MIIVLLAAGIIGAGTFVMDYRNSEIPVTKIGRNSYGEGEETHSFRVRIDGREQESPLEVSIGEKQYTKEEMDIVFQKAVKKLEKDMLGENRSLDHVDTDLNLVSEVKGEPVRVEWELDRYDLMNRYGERKEENIEKEPKGAVVTLTACLIYTQNEDMKIVREMAACVYPRKRSSDETALLMAKNAIEEEEASTKEADQVVLPVSVNGKRIEFRNLKNPRGWYVVLLGILICVLLVMLQKQDEAKERKNRRRQMLLDYPDITDKLALLLGAGITVKNAWERIAADYERRRTEQGVRYAYEEMIVAYHEMQSGVPEAECYERFGRRCELREYRKLATLLSQNLRKGTKGITDLLKAEAEQAFEERKAAAKRKGEEAGTKLLGPMFCMLAMVLIILIVPAFLAIQL